MSGLSWRRHVGPVFVPPCPMLQLPLPNASDATDDHSHRGDLQQDIIDMLKPVDDDRLKEGMPDTEFNRKYPPDAWCEEATPNARVWKICRDEAAASDRDMLESWNKTLDVLLIFAGLFSAVSTAFLVESYKTLQPDYSQYVASFLYSAAVAYNGSGNPLPPLDAIRSPDGPLQGTTIERWINGLWFISLTISLLVALLSILVKQWLDEYRARVSRSSPDHAHWARRHALYHDGLQSWGVPVIISFLPLLLHVSLFLFLAGLVLFLRLLDGVIALAVLVLLALLLGIYVLSMVLPAYYLDCPSKTPVLTYALRAWLACIALLLRVVSRVPRISSLAHVDAFIEQRIGAREKREAQAMDGSVDNVDARVLSALLDRSHDTDVLKVVSEALGAFSHESVKLFTQAYPEASTRVSHLIQREFDFLRTKHRRTGPFELVSCARLRRTRIALVNISGRPWYPRSYGFLALPDLRDALGLEGALLRVLEEWDPTFTTSCGIRNLVAALRSIDWIPASQYPGAADERLPRRSCLRLPLCLLFLNNTARLAELYENEQHTSPRYYSPHFYSLAMLVFCAALFASRPYSYEEQAAVQCFATLVQPGGGKSRNSSSTGNDSIDVDEARTEERIRSRGIDALYTMLAHMDEYNIHPDVADIVAPYAISLAAYSQSSWADRQGLSDLILSGSFEKYTASDMELAKYAAALSNVSLDDAVCSPNRTKELLLCTSVLASRAASLTFSPTQYYGALRCSLDGIIRHLYNNPRANNQDIILSHFLSDPALLERWMEIFSHCDEHPPRIPALDLQTRSVLAGTLACILRRRSRLKLEVKPEWTHTLFSNRLVVQLAESSLRIGARDEFGMQSPFLRHWRRLSPSSWSTMCDHLHHSRGESGLAEEVIERFRNGLFPGDIDGAAEIDCERDCCCMEPSERDLDRRLAEATARVSADGSWRARWAQRLKLWQPWTKHEPASNAGMGVHALSTEV